MERTDRKRRMNDSNDPVHLFFEWTEKFGKLLGAGRLEFANDDKWQSQSIS